MAFSSSLKHPVGPLLSAQRNFVNHNRKIISNNSLPVHSFSRFFPSVCAALKTSPRSTSDELLLGSLQSEIKWVEEQIHQPDETIPKGFPFQIHVNYEQFKISLTREYEGETIKIEAKQSDILDKDLQDPPSFPMVVTVSKTDGQYLEFGIVVHSDEICIHTCKLKHPDLLEPQVLFQPRSLEGNVGKELHKYLKTMGINMSTMKVVDQYLTANLNKEYKEWIDKVKEFVEEEA